MLNSIFYLKNSFIYLAERTFVILWDFNSLMFSNIDHSLIPGHMFFLKNDVTFDPLVGFY